MSQRFLILSLLLSLGLGSLSGCSQTFGTVGESNGKLKGKKSDQTVSKWDDCDIHFYDDLQEAQAVAQQEKKPLMLFFYAPNCIFSQQMLKETFRDDEVAKLSEQFICVSIDESRQRKMREEYDVKGTPTIQFMNPQGILLQRMTAKQNPRQLLLQMQITIESLAVRDRLAEVR